MTREEMKEIQTNRVPLGLETESIYNLGNVLHIVDECFYEFELMTCENCKYFIEESDLSNGRYTCGYWDGYSGVVSYPPKDFGCNRFEKTV